MPTSIEVTRPGEDDDQAGWDGAVRDRLVPLPPSAKLVAKVLAIEGDLSQGELAEESLLPGRTVRYALSRLEAADVVDARFNIHDARKQVYSLRTDE